MADTCYLCEMVSTTALPSGLAAGEGFGTCTDCSVHACPKHGERTVRHFRCSDCISHYGASGALTNGQAGSGSDAELRGNAPRLATDSGGLRATVDRPRMQAALRWIAGRLRSGEALRLAEAAQLGEMEDPRWLLGVREDAELSAEEAYGHAVLRAEELERAVHEALSSLVVEEPHAEQAELGATALGIAYVSRGAESVEVSPLQVAGGLTLPPAAAVLGHAYGRANSYFW